MRQEMRRGGTFREAPRALCTRAGPGGAPPYMLGPAHLPPSRRALGDSARGGGTVPLREGEIGLLSSTDPEEVQVILWEPLKWGLCFRIEGCPR